MKKDVPSGGIEPCYYCGVPANSIDHLPPQMVRHTLVVLGDTSYIFEEIPCCLECNSYLGAKLPWNKEDRKKKIKKYLKRRYHSVLLTQEYSEKEMEEFGENLKQYLKDSLLLRRITQERLKW